MNTPKKIKSDHTDSNKDDNEGYVLSLIEEYESFLRDVKVSGRPLWVICYYDGMVGTYTKNTGDNRQKD
jgi:hypothetical protein